MIIAERQLQTITESEVASIRESLRMDRSVRLSLPVWGWLYVDRRLPFLFLHRSPDDRRTFETEMLTLSESCALVLPQDESQSEAQNLLLNGLVEELSENGRFLIVELAATDVQNVEKPARPVPIPSIEIQADPTKDEELVRTLHQALESVEILDQSPRVRSSVIKDGLPGPHGTTVSHIRLVLSPVWVNPETREPFPIVLRDLREELSVALKKTAAFFCGQHSRNAVPHYEALGRREVLEEDWFVDRELSRIASRFQFLLDITPVNPRAAFREFEEGGFREEPEFHYRRLTFDPECAKGELYQVPVDEVEDPTLHRLFREKRAELARTLTMLEQRNTSDFLYSSLQQYGTVQDDLLDSARAILSALPASALPRQSDAGGVDAEEFGKIARSEMQSYREMFAGMTCEVKILPEITSLMVSRGNLLIPADLFIPHGRVNGLLHHEVGTHIVTWANGKSQRLSQLHTGFAGYDELQEGLAVLAEYLVGELSGARMRLLAGRVVAVRSLIEGASFPEIFHELMDHDFTAQQAFTVAMRVWRSGGLTKDAVYLRGLVRLLVYLRQGGDLDLLYIGKITEDHVGLVQELRRRQILREPPLRPRYLHFPEAIERLEGIRDGASVLDLIRKETSK